MRIVEPSVQLMDELDGAAVLEKIERCGRTCYKSEGRISPGSAEKFVRAIIARGHESVLEHVAVSLRIVCDRGVTHELVRHRIASFSQESTRYVRYAGGEMAFVKPCFWADDDPRLATWLRACAAAEAAYDHLLEAGASPQEARAVLPNSLRTEIVVTANLREWRHLLRLRLAKAAHPQMRQVARLVLDQLRARIPVVFDDLNGGEDDE